MPTYTVEALTGIRSSRAWYYLRAGLLLSVVPLIAYMVFFTPMEAAHDATHSVRHAFTFIACH